MGIAFHEILYRPIFNLLVFAYNAIPGHDLGIAIILVTLVVRIILHPLSHKAIKSQKALEALQPKIKEIQEKHKAKEDRARAVMEFYKENKINPASSFVPILLQLPLFFALYRVFLSGLNTESLSALYPFISNPGELKTMFLGIVNIAHPNAALAVLTGVAQFFQSKAMVQKKDGTQGSSSGSPRARGEAGSPEIAKMMSKQMMYVMPLFMVFIAWRLPAGLAIFWIVTSLFSYLEYRLIHKRLQTP
ncbi:MAG: membrane protein insertase YidC [Candidatus Spechtbacteria bacterium]|nr:membrane protein insertase YidC [Candidatus Spechtbacteria bacterium]